MPDNDRVSIDNLTTAPDLGSNDVLPVVHEVSGVKSTFKATLTAIGTFINKILNYSADLQTTNKTVIGAINELHNGGGGGGMSSDIIADTYDDTATYNTGDYCIYNDGLYVCDDDNVTGAWDSTKWTSIQVMSSIPTNAELLPIQSGSATNTKDYIESGLSGKADTIPDGSYTVSGIWSESYYASRSIWVSFPRADLYTISITRARYVSGTNTMTDITTTTQITNKNALGFQVYTTSNADNHFGDVQFTASLT